MGALEHVLKANIPNNVKRKVFDQCGLTVMTYSVGTLSFANNNNLKLTVAQVE